MTAQSHLKRYPSARSSTLAYLEKRQQTTEQLRREMAKPRPWWAFWRKR
jgi:SOS response regulatory protein OraA/RecX